ncbi:MAG: ribokinase [Pseudomonadota bacterium]
MIVIAGSVNLDLVARVERLPAPGETVSGITFEQSPGGKGANQALAARRAGAEVAMISAVGDDTNAAPATALLLDAGVDMSRVPAHADTPTGVALILVHNTSGENVIAVVPGANGVVQPQPLPDGANAMLTQMEIQTAVNEAMFDQAEAKGVPIIFNPAPYGADAVKLARRADVTIANETEFDLLADALALHASDDGENLSAERIRIRRGRAFVRETGKTLVITLGAAGALALSPDTELQAVPPAIDAKDTVGAGDTFCGYFAAAFADGQTLADCVDTAVVAGALACLSPGAQPAIPTAGKVHLARGKKA